MRNKGENGMHIADVKVPSEWVTLDSLITSVEADAEYIIVNSSPDGIYAVEGDTDPSEEIIGVPVPSGFYIYYTKGSQAHLYLRNGYSPVKVSGVDTQNKISNITINKVG